jgi:hypothetical protein
MSARNQYSMEQLREQLHQQGKQLTTQLVWTTDPGKRQRIKAQLAQIEQVADYLVEEMVNVFPELLLEADELGEMISALATAIQSDPGGESVDAMIKGIAAYLTETAQKVHPQAFEDASEEDRMFVKWSIAGLKRMRSNPLYRLIPGSVASVDQGLQALRDMWGDEFPDLFE